MKKHVLTFKKFYSVAFTWVLVSGIVMSVNAQDLAREQSVQAGWSVSQLPITEMINPETMKGALNNEKVSVSANDEDEAEKALLVYPNPAEDYVIVGFHAGRNEKITFELYDFNGRVIYKVSEVETLNAEVDLSGVRPGAYIAKVRAKNTVKTKIINVN